MMTIVIWMIMVIHRVVVAIMRWRLMIITLSMIPTRRNKLISTSSELTNYQKLKLTDFNGLKKYLCCFMLGGTIVRLQENYWEMAYLSFTYGEEKKVYQNKRWKFNVGQRRKMLTFPFFFDLSDSLINVSSLCSVNLLKCLWILLFVVSY